MAQGTLKLPAYVAPLTQALGQKLPGAKIDHEHVRGSRYRFIVVPKRFARMGHPERQQIVWDVAEATLKRSELVNVAMIITMAPSELPT